MTKTIGAQSAEMGILLHPHDVPVPPPSRPQLERAFYRRAARWMGTTLVTWPVWALTGAPTGVPRVVADHHHVVATAGIWPAYVMIGGFAALARKARRLYVDPVLDSIEADAEEAAELV